ncbi:MAG: phosphatase PAP2 family protein [bacterium]|nr:phosphatase PAP2 family protein [bacterium]
MTEFLNSIVNPLANLGSFVYALGFVVVFIESLFIVGHFIPGTMFLALLGFMCYLGIFNLATMVLVIYLGHFSAELVNYVLGRTRGAALFQASGRVFNPELLRKVEARFHANPLKILFLGQFIGVLRPTVAFVAGMTRYSLPRFVIPLAVADFLWTLIHLGIGYLLGASWNQAVHYVEGISVVVVLLIFVVWFSGWLIRVAAAHSGELRVIVEWLDGRVRRTATYGRLEKRHPAVFRFLEARLSLDAPWGIFATAGWVIVLVLSIHFLVILHNINDDPIWRYVDYSVINLMVQLRNPAVNRLLLWVTYVGSVPAVLTTAAVAVVICLWKRQTRSALVIAGSVGLALVSTQLVKGLEMRLRPDAALALVQTRGYSFPSGHTTVIVALFGGLYYWLWFHPGRRQLRATLAFLVVSFVVLIGFSRIYLGVHFPSDVWAGYSLGLACTVLLATLASNWRRVGDRPSRADWPVLAVLLAGMAVSTAIYARRPLLPEGRFISIGRPAPVATTAELAREAPRVAVGLPGRPVAPVNLVIIGRPEPLERRLLAEGWRVVAPDAFFTSQIQRPIFPVFIQSVPAQLTLWRALPPGGRMILRLWRTRWTLGGRETWVGSVLAEREKRLPLGLVHFNADPDLDAATEAFASGLGKEVTARPLGRFRPRGLYEWPQPFFTHGGALLLGLGDGGGAGDDEGRVTSRDKARG